MDEHLQVVVDGERPRAVVVRVRGRVDGRTAQSVLEQCLEAHVPGKGLVLNLEGVTFLSSAGVGVLMVLADRLGNQGGLRLAPVSKPVNTVLGLLNLDQFLTIDSSEDDAVAGLGS
jgi:anti-anti-sigma factor